MIEVGDWGLGIGDCPIPNPQSPIPKYLLKLFNILLINQFKTNKIK